MCEQDTDAYNRDKLNSPESVVALHHIAIQRRNTWRHTRLCPICRSHTTLTSQVWAPNSQKLLPKRQPKWGHGFLPLPIWLGEPFCFSRPSAKPSTDLPHGGWHEICTSQPWAIMHDASLAGDICTGLPRWLLLCLSLPLSKARPFHYLADFSERNVLRYSYFSLWLQKPGCPGQVCLHTGRFAAKGCTS